MAGAVKNGGTTFFLARRAKAADIARSLELRFEQKYEVSKHLFDVLIKHLNKDLMARVKSEAVKVLKERMIALRKSGLLPKGYAEEVLTKLQAEGKAKESWTVDTVYNVTRGRSTNEVIVDLLIKMATENKMQNQIGQIDELLKP